jgi:hypothetical protein
MNLFDFVEIIPVSLSVWVILYKKHRDYTIMLRQKEIEKFNINKY